MKNEHKFEDMSIEDIKNILQKIGKNKIIMLFGGEPTIRDDIFEIIKTIHESGNVPGIYTNGLRLTDFDYVKKLKESGVEIINFSFDGFREDIYEKLRGDKNHLYIKMKALQNLVRLNITTVLSSVIAYGINEDQIPLLLKFCMTSVKNGNSIKGIRFFPFVPYGKFDIEMNKFITTTDIIKILEEYTNSHMKKEYFIEFKKLLKNINCLLDGLIYFPTGNTSPYVLFKVEDNNIKELIELDDLKRINLAFEKKDIVSLLKCFMRNKNLFKYVLRFITKRNTRDIFKDNILMVSLGFTSTPITNFSTKNDTIGIQKNIDKIEFLGPS
jgi:MoaA/NifB/PqqE/SkfB family radical SAM enzyme